MIYSYDVFDTLITRKTITPTGIFLLVQNRILHNEIYSEIPLYLKYNFSTIRKNAEFFLKRRVLATQCEEITLDEIYDFIAENNGLNQSVILLLKECEIQYELENVIGIQQNISDLKKQMSSGHKVILISDTYLPSKLIKKMLLSVDPIFIDISLYISSEIKLTKTTGNLYKYISRSEGYSYHDWIHIGDNDFSDVLCPSKLGIKVKKYAQIPLLSYEEAIIKKHGDNVGVQISVGLSRVLCINHSPLSPLGIIGLSMAGPLLYGYVLWVLEHAERLNLCNLYFIARDGFVLKKIADEILRIIPKKICTHYIYGSRIAWRIQEINELLDFKSNNRVFQIKTISDLAYYLNMDNSTLCKFLPTKYHNSKLILSKDEISTLLNKLMINLDFQKEVNKSVKIKKELLKHYFQHEINFNEPFAFVDLYGTGKTIGYVNDLMKQDILKIPYVFYLSGSPDQSHNPSQLLYWKYDLALGNMLEILCRAPHGQTIGYRENDETVEPILDSEFKTTSPEYIEYLSMIEKYSSELTRAKRDFNIECIDNVLFDYYYTIFSRQPSRLLLNTLSKIPYSSSTGSTSKIFAPKKSLLTILLDYYHNGYIGDTTGSISYSLSRVSPIHRLIGQFIIDGYYNKNVIKKYIQAVGIVSFIKWFFLKKN
mgnify:CR=1 FL=1